MPKPKPKPKLPRAAPPAAAIAGPGLPPPVIVLPGNPGSTLIDLYPTRPDELWAQPDAFLGFPKQVKELDRVRLHPDAARRALNATGRAIQPARIQPLNPLHRPYEDLVDTLRREIRDPYHAVPVFPFGYDWRLPAGMAADDLAEFIPAVLETTSLLPEYQAAPPTQLDLVAHSFGGLVLARYLAQCQKSGKASHVRKVVTLGSSLQGTPEAAHKLTGDYKERHTARTLPSVFEHMPYYTGAVTDATRTKAVDLKDPNNWPSSVREGLVGYCAMISSKTTGLEFFEAQLAAMRDHWSAIQGLDLDTNSPLPGGRDGWLAIAGVGERTRVRVRVRQQGGAPWFETDEEDDIASGRTGDGAVPFYGAVPPFLGPERVVCLKDDDIEIQERATWVGMGELLGLASFHSFLPMMNAAQRIVVAFLRDTPPKAELRARLPPGIAAGQQKWPAWLKPL